VFPLTAGLAVRAFGIPCNAAVRSLWLTVFLLNLAAIAANTSRMAQLIGGLILIALLIRLGPRVLRGLSGSEKNIIFAGTAAVLLATFAIARASHLEQPMQRWEQTGDKIAGDLRWSAARVALTALPQAGLFGSGPGTFRAVFPSYTKLAEQQIPGRWRFLHEDYLQTVIEWGWVGALLWGALFFGGITVAIRALRTQNKLRRGQASPVRGGGTKPPDSTVSVPQRSSSSKQWSWRRRLILPLAIIALLGVAVHALIDFPLQIESLQLYVATYLGLCWGSVNWKT
jgi:hypothetical protein